MHHGVTVQAAACVGLVAVTVVLKAYGLSPQARADFSSTR